MRSEKEIREAMEDYRDKIENLVYHPSAEFERKRHQTMFFALKWVLND